MLRNYNGAGTKLITDRQSGKEEAEIGRTNKGADRCMPKKQITGGVGISFGGRQKPQETI